MIELSTSQQKVLDIYHNEGHIKAWNYWKLIGNTYGIFLGEVPSDDFIDGVSLANHIGLTNGVLCNIDTPWLKFILDDQTVYVPMKPLMHTVSWDKINECGAVFENVGATIDIGSNMYDITLLRGLNDVCNRRYIFGFDDPETQQSEWNRLMYPIHSGIHTDSLNPSSPSLPFTQWASYNDSNLSVNYSLSSGSASWVQETINDHSTKGLIRGSSGITYVGRYTSTFSYIEVGWRPALRLKV